MNAIKHIIEFITSSTDKQFDQSTYSHSKFEEFFRKGKSNGYCKIKDEEIHVEKEKISEWIKYGRKIRLLSTDQFNITELGRLKGAFTLCIVILLLLIICLSYFTINFGSPTPTESLIKRIVAAGILGSTLTAFISCLNRRANGFEDSYGNSLPSENASKEQFNIGMFNWLLLRPLLGLVAYFVYLWIDEMNFSDERLITIGFVSGLMAKTVISLFKEWPKTLLKI